MSARVYERLFERLQCINGEGVFITELGRRLRRGLFDTHLDNGQWVMSFGRRTGPSGEARTDQAGASTYSKTVVFDAVVSVPRDSDAQAAIENALADIERAIELEDDLFLYDSQLNRNLLVAELRLEPAQLEIPEGFDAAFLTVGIPCTFPHQYGDPDHVT